MKNALFFISLIAFTLIGIPAHAESQPKTDTLAPSPLPKVVSINLCADQLVLAFAQHEQILSLSNLSHDPAGSVYAAAAKAYPINTGLVEEVLPLKPDIVIAGQYSSRYTLGLLKSVGLRVEILPVANSMETLIKNILSVSTWLGQPESGEQAVAAIRKRLNQLSPITEPKPKAAVYDPNGYTVGTNSLRGEILNLAGWHNVATDKGIDSYGSLSLESLISLQPDALFESPYSPDTWSRGQALSVHPAIQQRGLQTKTIRIPSSNTICGGPWSMDLIETLQHERIQMQSQLDKGTSNE